MRVTVYSLPNCQGCRATKRKLTQLGQDFTEVMITNELAEGFRERGLTMAPIVQIELGDRVADEWAGYHPDKLNGWFKKIKIEGQFWEFKEQK